MSPGPGLKMGPRTHERPPVRSYIPARDSSAPGWPDRSPADGDHAVAAGVRGALLPGRAGGDLLHRGADRGRRGGAGSRPGHQGAADRRRWRRRGTLQPSRDSTPRAIKAAAERYARKNRGHVVKLERRGVDVKVWVDTNDDAGRRRRDASTPEDARGIGARPGAHRRDRDRGAGGGGGNIGSSGGGGIKRIKKADWEDLKDEISEPPTCGHDAKSNDLVKLGKMLREHGFAVAENAEMGDDPAAGVHADERLPLQVPALRRARRQRRQRARAPRSQLIDGIVGRRPEARLPHDLAGGRATSTTSTSTSPTRARSASAAATAARSARSRRPGWTSS